jgi:hypothetical protein
MPKKLIIPRATRINEDEARVLTEIETETGLKSAEVDREILTWFASTVARMRRKDQALLQFLRSLRFETA